MRIACFPSHFRAISGECTDKYRHQFSYFQEYLIMCTDISHKSSFFSKTLELISNFLQKNVINFDYPLLENRSLQKFIMNILGTLRTGFDEQIVEYLLCIAIFLVRHGSQALVAKFSDFLVEAYFEEKAAVVM
jgi:hypothetical protein